jgi:hypothetical protein
MNRESINNFPSFGSFPSFNSFPGEIKKIEPNITAEKEQRDKIKKKKHKRNREYIDHSEISLDYYIDRRGDANNVKYQEIRDQPIPIYKRISKKVLGVPNCYITVQKNNQIHLMSQTRKPTRAKYIDFLRETKKQRIPMLNNGAVESMDEDFIEFSGYGYEVIATTVEDSTSESEFQKKSAELAKSLDRDPYNINAWIEFLKFQDSLYLYNSTQSRSSLKQRIVTKKTAVLEKALDYNPDSDELIAMYMELLEETLDDRTMLARWDDLLNEHSMSFLLWKQYLDYRMRNTSSFVFTDIIQCFGDCMSALDEHSDGKV